MPPKKPAADSTEPSDSSSNEEPAYERNDKKSDAAPHPSTAVMVKEALQALDSRKGVSSQAIQKFIKEKYPSVDPVRLKTLVRKNLKKGLETGTLVKPGNSSMTTGTRRFRLAPKTKPKAENGEASVKKSPKVTKDGAKKLSKAGATKKDTANGQAKSKEGNSKDSKPPKRSKKDEDATTKLPPAKKPKGKKAESTEDGEKSSNATKTKAKKTKKAKTGKAKVAKADSTSPASKANGK